MSEQYTNASFPDTDPLLEGSLPDAAAPLARAQERVAIGSRTRAWDGLPPAVTPETGHVVVNEMPDVALEAVERAHKMIVRIAANTDPLTPDPAATRALGGLKADGIRRSKRGQ